MHFQNRLPLGKNETIVSALPNSIAFFSSVDKNGLLTKYLKKINETVVNMAKWT